jgi:hypothetical protein
MRDRSRKAAVRAALAVACLTMSCAPAPQVSVVRDPHVDLTGVRTWDWIEGRAVVVRAAEYDAGALESRLTALIESELSGLGFARDPVNPQLRVAALLVARRSLEAMRRPTALQTLHTFHDGGAYEVQSEVTDLRSVDRLRLAVFLTSAHQEQLLWQAQLDARYPGGFAPHLDEALATVMDDFRRLAATRTEASR